ncbi:hypothetical protein TrCOL_g6426 [Triparma columacea]|uniref:Palmitoyltransferase n=1 Tax=Triparma columacea TaxID=722753 RepID=A0A9W7GL40_9STRA|nr:hypothetical protein TrCOL_g6426 [Triparma columacea]
MQCLYLTIVLSAWTCMVIYGYPIIRNPSNTFISSYHCNVGYFVYALCLYTFYRACTVPAGNLTESTLERYDNYKYDNVLYVPRICKTLSFRKVARSKFDRATNKHVPRFDHFCVWLNQPIGEENYRDFLLFLIVHCGMLCYGSYASGKALWFVVKHEGLLRVKFVNRATGKTVAGSPLVIFRYMAHSHAAIICLLVLSSIMGLVMIIFTLFHLWLCGRGMTTNEYFKWRDIWSWHKDATKKYEKAKVEGNAGERWTRKGKDYETLGVWEEMVEEEEEEEVGCTGVKKGWGERGGGEEKEGGGENENGEEKEGKEKKVRVEDPGPLPKNIYNRGVYGNFHEVLFPRSLRMEAESNNKNGGKTKKKKKLA